MRTDKEYLQERKKGEGNEYKSRWMCGYRCIWNDNYM